VIGEQARPTLHHLHRVMLHLVNFREPFPLNFSQLKSFLFAFHFQLTHLTHFGIYTREYIVSETRSINASVINILVTHLVNFLGHRGSRILIERNTIANFRTCWACSKL